MLKYIKNKYNYNVKDGISELIIYDDYREPIHIYIDTICVPDVEKYLWDYDDKNIFTYINGKSVKLHRFLTNAKYGENVIKLNGDYDLTLNSLIKSTSDNTNEYINKGDYYDMVVPYRNKNIYVSIDIEDYPKCKEYKWVSDDKYEKLKIISCINGRIVTLQRFIMDVLDNSSLWINFNNKNNKFYLDYRKDNMYIYDNVSKKNYKNIYFYNR